MLQDSGVLIALITGATVVITSVCNLAASLLGAKRSKGAESQAIVAANASTAAAQNAATAVEQTSTIANGWSTDVNSKLDNIDRMLHNHLRDKELHHFHRQSDEIHRR